MASSGRELTRSPSHPLAAHALATHAPRAPRAPAVRLAPIPGAWCQPRLLRLGSRGAAALRLCRFRRASSDARTDRASARTATGVRSKRGIHVSNRLCSAKVAGLNRGETSYTHYIKEDSVTPCDPRHSNLTITSRSRKRLFETRVRHASDDARALPPRPCGTRGTLSWPIR